MYATDKVYHDSRQEEIESLPDTAFHRNVDLAIVGADREGIPTTPSLILHYSREIAGYLRAYIVSPPLIFGTPSGPIFDAGLANRHSIQIPLLIKTSLARGQAAMVGEGKSIWNHAHVNDGKPTRPPVHSTL